ncbi:MAG: hypothetical protein ABII27_08425 [bacterium]
MSKKPFISVFASHCRGSAIMAVSLILGFLLPVMLIFIYLAPIYLKSGSADAQIKSASSLSKNMMIDIMRQLSQGYYHDHYDPDFLDREEVFYKYGFSDGEVVADEQNHTLNITAKGKFGKQTEHPLYQKTVHFTVQFISPWVQYGNFMYGGLTISAVNITYGGPVYVGQLTITNTSNNNTWVGGPVITNTIQCDGSNQVMQCDLYCSNGMTGTIPVTVQGTVYNYIPDVDYPRISSSYYRDHCNKLIVNDSIITFNADGTYTVQEISPVSLNTYMIPANGLVMYAADCNLTITGTLNGRATIVAYDEDGLGTDGKISVLRNLVYAHGISGDGKYHASANDSLAVIAHRELRFEFPDPPPNTYSVCGFYFFSGDAVVDGPNGSPQYTNKNTFFLYGTRNCGSGPAGWYGSPSSIYNASGHYDIGFDRNFIFDEFLKEYPPPNLPEKPYIVSFDIR